MRNPATILVKNEELTLDGIKQFYIPIDKEEWKFLTLVELYKKKSRNVEEKKTLRFLITKYAAKRTFVNGKGKEVSKRPKIQRLITPERLRRKRVNTQIKEENRKANQTLLKAYRDKVKSLRRPTASKKVGGKK